MRAPSSGGRNGPSATRLAAITIVIVLGCWATIETHLSLRASRAASEKGTLRAELALSLAVAELEVIKSRGRNQSQATSSTDEEQPNTSSTSSTFSQPSKRINWKEARRKTNGASARPVQSDGGGIPGGGLVPGKRERATRANAAAMMARGTASAVKSRTDGGQAGYDSGNRSDGIIRNIAMYFSTSFGGTTRLDSEGRTSSATTYIDSRGELMALWSPRVAHFTLVTDAPATGATLAAFAAKHGCFQGFGDDAVVDGYGANSSSSSSDSGGDSGDSGRGTLHYARRWSCPAWGPSARMLTTPCASAWWGAAGPCCKFDHAVWDFYRRPRFASGSATAAARIEWVLYSDDDLWVRPLTLQRFLANFNATREVVLGANRAGARLRDARSQARAARAHCGRTLAQQGACVGTLGSTAQRPGGGGVVHGAAVLHGPGSNLHVDPERMCTAPPPPRAAYWPIEAAAAAPPHVDYHDAAWRPCETAAATRACVACVRTTMRAVAACMARASSHHFFPGNLQPFLASAAAMQRLRSVLDPTHGLNPSDDNAVFDHLGAAASTDQAGPSSGNETFRTTSPPPPPQALQALCLEWGVSHDFALTLLAWMVQLEYVEAAGDCGAYAFAHRVRGASACAAAGMIDRVKSPADLAPCTTNTNSRSGSGSGSSSGGGGSTGTGSSGGYLPGAVGAAAADLLERWPLLRRGAQFDPPTAATLLPAVNSSSCTSSSSSSSSSSGSGSSSSSSSICTWDMCFQKHGGRAYRAVRVPSVQRTSWWRRTLNATRLVRPPSPRLPRHHGPAEHDTDATAASDDGVAVAVGRNATARGWRLDLFGVSDCLNHVPTTPLPPGFPDATYGAPTLTAAATARLQARR